MTIHELKVRNALFTYLKSTEFRDRFYFLLVYEKSPFNAYCLYQIEYEDSAEIDSMDLNITYMIDYDEGQDIEVISVYSKEDIFEMILYDYERRCLNEQKTSQKEKKEASSESQ